MMKKSIPFTVSARTAILIGRDNISSSEGAVIELVKNTYDADATCCVLLFRRPYLELPDFLSEEDYKLCQIQYPDIGFYYIKNNNSSYDLKEINDTNLQPLKDALYKIEELWVIDNGLGMSSKIIEDNWMVIGTDTKNRDSKTKKGRANTGAKGIGRFALDRLGARTNLFSQHEAKTIEWSVDWDTFEVVGKTINEVNATFNEVEENLEEICSELNFKERSNDDGIQDHTFKSGTAIKIANLRNVWLEKDKRKLFTSLRALVPPAEQKDFNIYLFDETDFEKYGQVEAQLPNSFDYKLVAKFRPNRKKVSFEIVRSELDKTLIDDRLFSIPAMDTDGFRKKDFNDDSYNYDRKFGEIFIEEDFDLKEVEEIGAFDFTLYFFKLGIGSGDRKKFPYKYFQPGPRKKWLSEHGGIRIYRDNFRVRPYGEVGEPAFDWLSLGPRRSRSPAAVSRRGAYRVDPNQLSGTIRISRLDNPRLADQMNREGIQDWSAFEIFKQICRKIVQEFERDRNNIFASLSELYDELNPKQKTQSEGDKAAKKAKEKPEDLDSDDALKLAQAYEQSKERIEELESELSLMRALSTMGTVLLSFSHELAQLKVVSKDRAAILYKLVKIHVTEKKANEGPKELNPFFALKRWGNDDKKMEHWLDFALNSVKANKRKKDQLNLEDYLGRLEDRWEPFFTTRKIHLTTELVEGFDPSFDCYEIDLDSMLNNLIINSKEAFMSKRHKGDRNISVSVSPSLSKGYFLIRYEDSGPGLHPSIDDPNRIFDFSFTTKTSPDIPEDSGTGLGMWIVNSTLSEYNGTARILSRTGLGGFGIELELPIAERKK